jgi:penicillin amidase
MLTIFRWLVRITTGILVLSFVVVMATNYFLSRSLPDYDEDFSLSGVTERVEIVRNNADVPHIFGRNDEDVFFALGFAHAQDRLWQMTMLRRTVQGRMSEIFGKQTLGIDEVMRRFDLYDLSLQSVAVQDAPTKAALLAYSKGVNAWISQVNLGARGRGAPEFFFFAPTIDTWAPADSIAIIKLMALQQSSMIENEVLRARLSLALNADRLADILPDDPGQAVMGLPQFSQVMPGVEGNQLPLHDYAQIDDPLSPFKSREFAGASNAWAAAPFRSAAGGSLLANDPHSALSAPSPWYLARLQLASGDVIGATIPGVPVILMGRSEMLGWGLTTANLDDQDVVIERINPENPEQYLTPEGSKDFLTRKTIVQIKDSPSVTLTLRWSEAGPIMPGSFRNLASITPGNHVAAIEWSALTGKDTTLTALMRIMKAHSVDEAIAAGSLYVAPAQNLMLADAKGIGFQMIGWMPSRAPAHRTKGRMPAPGWEGENRWLAMLPYADNPRDVAPPSGLLGNTNNKIVDRPFPLHVSYDWGDTQRIQRFLDLMKERNIHTRDSFIEAQLDTVSPTARTLLPLIGADLWFTGDPAADGTPERQRQKALELMAQWNGEMNEHLPEPLIAEAWLRALQRRLTADDLGPLLNEFTHPEPVFIERVFRNIAGASVWCDVKQSAPTETCTDIARDALDDALIELAATYGPNIESWRWGDAHQATHDHPVLGEVPFLRYFVNIRQSTSGGDSTLMRGLTKGTGPRPYENVHSGAYRGVYDFADPDSSVFIISTGQSGHPLSRHYDDLSVLWRTGEYIPMSLDPALARAGAVGITRLTPASGP